MRKSIFIYVAVALVMIGIGKGLNLLVMSVNGGYMPVKIPFTEFMNVPVPGAVIDSKHVVMTGLTVYPYLGDVIPLPFGLGPGGLVSVGDLIVMAGTVIPILYLFEGGKKRKDSVTLKERQEVTL